MTQESPAADNQHAQAHVGQGAPADGILSTLADLESRLASLKNLHNQSATRAEHLVKHEAELSRREAELTRREQEVGKREGGVDEREGLLAHRVEEWRTTVAQVESQQEKLSNLERSLADQREKLEQVRTKLEIDAREAGDRSARNAQLQRELEHQSQTLSAQLQALSGREQGLSSREESLNAREKQHRQAESEFEKWAAQSRTEIERHAAAAQQRLRELDAREKEILSRIAALEQREGACKDAERELDEKTKRLEKEQARVRKAEEEVGQVRRQVEAREGQAAAEHTRLQGLQAELDALRERLEEQRSIFEHEADVARADISRRQGEVSRVEQELTQQRDEIKRRLEELDRDRAAVSEQQRTLLAQTQSDSAAGAISSGRVEMLQIQIGEANAKRAAVEAELAQIKEEAERLREQLASSSGESDLKRLQAEIEKRDHAIMVLRERFAELQAAYKALQEQAGAPDGAGSRNGSVKGGKGAEGKDSRNRRSGNAAANGSSAGGAGAGIGADMPGFLKHRRTRLARYKTLLQQQARKIMSAQAGLAKRLSECEQVFAQRSKLSALAQELARKEKRLNLSKARSGLGMAMLGFAAAAGVMGLLSWQAAQRIWPGEYIASAAIEADTHGRTPSDDELAQWQRYHEELVTNPQMIEVAADRMNRRGIATLSRPADLAAKVKTDLFTSSTQPGVLTIELKHEGSEKARLVLDTFVTSLKSVSDAAREQRSEDLGVTIVQTAIASDKPSNEKELLGYAGGLFGGAMLAVGLFGMLVWSRLISAKRKFEKTLAVEEALSEVDWENLEQSVRRNAAEAHAGHAGRAHAQSESQPASKPTAAGKKKGR